MLFLIASMCVFAVTVKVAQTFSIPKFHLLCFDGPLWFWATSDLLLRLHCYMYVEAKIAMYIQRVYTYVYTASVIAYGTVLIKARESQV